MNTLTQTPNRFTLTLGTICFVMLSFVGTAKANNELPSGLNVAKHAAPFALVTFTTETKNHQMISSWTVSNEEQVKGYELEGSKDGSTFKTIRLIAARNSGTYTIVNRRPVNQCDYYRLKLVNTDGDFSYSQVVKLKSEVEATAKEKTFRLNVENELVSQAGTVTIANAEGRILITQSYEKLKQVEKIDISALTAGKYAVRLLVGTKEVITSMEVSK